MKNSFSLMCGHTVMKHDLGREKQFALGVMVCTAVVNVGDKFGQEPRGCLSVFLRLC